MRAAGGGGVNVDDELFRALGGFLIDDLKPAKNEAEGVDDDAGAAGGEAALCDKDDHVGENGVDFLDGAERRNARAEKPDGDVAGFGVWGHLSRVFAAEEEDGIRGFGAATAAAMGDVTATVIG